MFIGMFLTWTINMAVHRANCKLACRSIGFMSPKLDSVVKTGKCYIEIPIPASFENNKTKSRRPGICECTVSRNRAMNVSLYLPQSPPLPNVSHAPHFTLWHCRPGPWRHLSLQLLLQVSVQFPVFSLFTVSVSFLCWTLFGLCQLWGLSNPICYSDKRAFHLELQHVCHPEYFPFLLFLSLSSLCNCTYCSKPKPER